ncbi:MAG: 4Fe-4S dicluster domain-containing protein [Candidatus Oleimicrobiaceae bacterium]
MLHKRQRTFKGGFIFSRLEGEPEPQVEETPVPGLLRVPLAQGPAAACRAVVKAGDRVLRGQLLGEAIGDLSFPTHAPAGGVVRQVQETSVGGAPVLTVCIEPDARDGEQRLPGAMADFERLRAEEVQQLLYAAGVSALFRDGFPGPAGSCRLAADQVELVVIAALATEPFLPKPAVLLKGRVEDFSLGVRVLHQALPRAMIVIAHGQSDTEAFTHVSRQVGDPPWLSLRAVVEKYPQEHPAILMGTLLGQKKAPSSPSALGALVGDVQCVLHAKEAVVEGRPVTERIIALGGQAFSRTGHLRVRIGSPLQAVVHGRLDGSEKAYFVLGGLLTGRRLNDLEEPVTRTTAAIAALPVPQYPELMGSFLPGTRSLSKSNAFLSAILPFVSRRLTPNLQGERRPCVQCNYCEEVCPVDIIPHLLSKQVTHDLVDEAERFGIMACIECGLCSYVCPSKIDLVADIQGGKRVLIEERERYAETA